MTFPLQPKTAAEVVDRYFDWTPRLDDDYLIGSTVTVTSGTITLSNSEFTRTKSLFTVSGGAEGETAALTAVVTTIGGQTLDQDLTMYIGVEAVETPFGPSTLTKGAMLELMFEELGSAGYQFDHGPDEQASALRKMDLMMSAQPFGSLPLGYNAPPVAGQSDMADLFGVADQFAQTLAVALAKRYSPAWGKTMSGQSRKDYAEGLNYLITTASRIPAAILDRRTPLGSGNKWRSVWAPYAGWRNYGYAIPDLVP